MTANMVVVVKDMAICRIKDGDSVLPGRTDKSGYCLIEGRKEAEYQVLVDSVGMARLEWRHWDMFTKPEIGSVAYNERFFIARFERNGEEIVGNLDFGRGMYGEIRAFTKNMKQMKRTEGQVLVEVEPIKYQLENITFLVDREVKIESKIHLGSACVSADKEDNPNWVLVRHKLSFLHPSYSYWGHVPGKVRGLPARVRVNTTTFTQFVWGVEHKEEVVGEYIMQARLQGGTEQNKTLTGLLVRREVPYTASLMMVYRDGVVRRHKVSATHVNISLEKTVEGSVQPFFTQSGLPAPKTTTTTKTTKSRTAVTTTRTATTTTTTTTKMSSTTTASPFSPASLLLSLKSSPTRYIHPNKSNPLRLFYPRYDSSSSDSVSDSVLISSVYSGSWSLSLSSVMITVTVCLCLRLCTVTVW